MRKPSYKNLKVTVYLGSYLAQDAPQLDSLIICTKMINTNQYKVINKALEPPEIDEDIPIKWKTIDGKMIAMCSNPIIDKPKYIGVEYMTKKIDPQKYNYIKEEQHKKLLIASGPYKMTRKPIKILDVEKIVWFAVGWEKELKEILNTIFSLGHLRNIGYGLIKKWEIEEIENDYTWFVENNNDKILMRTLPNCDELPKNLTGYKKSFGGYAPPYWHPDRMCEIVEPC